jgi:hypothetical protein
MAMRERDPMHWAFPLPWRPMGVTVKIHILFPCVVLGLILWVATSKQFAEKLWNVTVLKVRTSVVRGKEKRMGRFVGRRSNWKRALVTLAAGQSIDFFEGV